MTLGKLVAVWAVAVATVGTGGVLGARWAVNRISDSLSHDCEITQEVIDAVKPGQRIGVTEGKCVIK